MLSEQDFRLETDRALEQAQRALLPLADQEGFEVELQNGVLQVIFEEPPPRQVRRQSQRSGPAGLGVGNVSQL